jgi:hypothetical protein
VKINAGCGIRNKFEIHVDNVETGEHREYKAHNIILNSMWDRLTAFNPYFVNIHYGTGDAEFNNPARTTLNSFLGTKAAVHVSRSAAYPTSQWRKRIVLQPDEEVGKTIKEVGIAYGSTANYLLTHAPIQDSEGNPIQLGPKLDTEIYTIYADIFVSLWSDYGAYFYANGLRNYLLGSATMAADQIAASFVGQDPVDNTYNLDMLAKSSTRTRNASEKWVQGKVRFEAADYNKDIRFLHWVNMGMQIELPRPGVWEGIEKTGVILGAGDGSNKTFAIPNREPQDVTIYVDNVAQTKGTDWDFDILGNIEFGTAPASALPVTADYYCPYIPKDSDHVLDVIFRLYFDMDEPQAITPPDYSVLPAGSLEPNDIKGDETLGFFGEVASANLITGADLITALGITQGTNIADAGWLKFARKGRIIFVAKKAIRHSISWNHINSKGAVYGQAVITIGGVRYAVRLLSSAEWNALIYPVHVDYGQWWNYTNADLLVASGDGRASWTSTPSGSSRVCRGYGSVTDSGSYTPSNTDAFYGFRPVLEPLLPWSAD